MEIEKSRRNESSALIIKNILKKKRGKSRKDFIYCHYYTANIYKNQCFIYIAFIAIILHRSKNVNFLGKYRAI